MPYNGGFPTEQCQLSVSQIVLSGPFCLTKRPKDVRKHVPTEGLGEGSGRARFPAVARGYGLACLGTSNRPVAESDSGGRRSSTERRQHLGLNRGTGARFAPDIWKHIPTSIGPRSNRLNTGCGGYCSGLNFHRRCTKMSNFGKWTTSTVPPPASNKRLLNE